MREQHKDRAYYLGKAEVYRKKANAATNPSMRAAFEAVVREYLRRARRLQPTSVPHSRT
jgi:hypothetical protein